MALLIPIQDGLSSSSTLLRFCALALVSWILYGAALAIFRLYFSPISHIPGPKLAAMTQYYESYYDLIVGGGGNFTRQIKKIHDKYGPIVRINPFEVHIDDPEFFETIYTPSPPYSKLKFFENRFNVPHSTFSTADFAAHKPRRAAVAPFFSSRKMQGCAPIFQSLIDKISGRLTEEYVGTGKILCLNDVLGCLTGDVILSLAFARSQNLIDTQHWESPFTSALKSMIATCHWMAHFSWIVPVMNSIPDQILMALSSQLRPMLLFRQEMKSQIRDLLRDQKNQQEKLTSRSTVFLHILQSKLAPEELSQDRLREEAILIVGAGFETTKWTLTVAFYHILANPAIYQRLRQELASAMPNPEQILSWHELQALPYLSACIDEALRVGYGLVQRSPRISHDRPFQYKQYTIPPGIGVSQDAFHMHHHEEIFPESHTYKPERWLGNPKGPDGIKQLSRYMVAFGRGTRSCLGMHMALLEIYLTIVTLLRRFEFELFDTDSSNVAFYQDFVTPQPKPGALGVRVRVVS